MSQTLEKILEEVKALSEGERRQLAAILSSIDRSGPVSSAEREFETKLAAEGWLSLPQPSPLEVSVKQGACLERGDILDGSITPRRTGLGKKRHIRLA